MDAIRTTIDTSLSVPGFTARFATYEAQDAGPHERTHADHYLTHILSPSTLDVRMNRAEPSVRGPALNVGRFQFMPNTLSLLYRNTHGTSRVAQGIFEPGAFARVIGGNEFEDGALARYADIRAPRIRDPMIRLERELREQAFDSLILVEALGLQLTVEIARQFRRGVRDGAAGGTLSDWQVKRIAEFIHASCGRGPRPSVRTLADLCGISGGHLMRSFKRTTGETVHGFVSRVRLEKARDLLRQSDVPLQQVATQTGFSSQSHFSNAFRDFFHERPSSYRARTRKRLIWRRESDTPASGI